MIEPRTTTQIYINSQGYCMTRLWYPKKVKGEIKQLMREFPTDKSEAKRFLSSHGEPR